MAGSSTFPERSAPYAVAPDRYNEERSDEDLGVGKACSDPSCSLVDFLPLKCNHCAHSFCQKHFLPEVHKCAKWDRGTADRHPVACPVCKVLITIPPGDDPNVRVGRHLDEECGLVMGKVKKSSAPTCSRARCKKLLWQPIRCDKCRKEFCATHRYPDAHFCASLSTSTSNSNSSPSYSFWKVPSSAARSSAAMARQAGSSNGPSSAMRSNSKPAALPAATPPLVTSSSGAHAVTAPSDTLTGKLKAHFSPQDRRAKAERQAQIRAMEERLRRGLLSEKEKEILVALQERAQKEEEEASDCVIA